MDSPLVTAIVPVFNKAPYLLEAIESLRAQAYPNLEILIRDDGSTDSSAVVMNELSSTFPDLRIRLFFDSNRGASFSRNFLIERAAGELLCLMDADDQMAAGFIPSAVSVISAQGASVVYSDVELIGDRTGEWCPPAFDAYTIRYGNGLTTLSVLKKSLWSQVGGYNVGLPFNEDWSFFINVAQRTNGFVKLPGKYFRYRQLNSGLYRSFVNEHWAKNLAMVTMANPRLYPVEEVLSAIDELETMPVAWQTKLADHAAKHPTSPLPRILLALPAGRSGNISLYQSLLEGALSLTDEENRWIVHFLLARLFMENDSPQALSHLHAGRMLRPDFARLANPEINKILSASRNSAHTKPPLV
jgi:glycosyltransferase involved in cell wall biosynthesis